MWGGSGRPTSDGPDLALILLWCLDPQNLPVQLKHAARLVIQWKHAAALVVQKFSTRCWFYHNQSKQLGREGKH